MKYVVEKLLPNELRPGMILAHNIIIDNVKLLVSGVKLTDRSIDKIKNLQPFMDVYVYKVLDKGDFEADVSKHFDDENYKYANLSKERKVKAIKLEKTLNTFTKDLKRVFKYIADDEKLDIDDIRKYSKTVVEEFGEYDYDILIKNLLFDNKTDDYLYKHSLNVSILASMIGKWMGIEGRDLLLLTYSALLHDVGKTLIPKEILNKPGMLTKREFDEVKKHTEHGYRIVKKAQYLDQSVGFGVLMHHERMDGSGYPLGLKGDKIHLFAKIIAVADEFDAMTSNKVYSKKKSPFLCLEELQSVAWNKLDGDVCAAFLKHLASIYTGEFVRLNNGKVGKIIKIEAHNISRPLLSVDEEFIDLKMRNDLYIEELV